MARISRSLLPEGGRPSSWIPKQLCQSGARQRFLPGQMSIVAIMSRPLPPSVSSTSSWVAPHAISARPSPSPPADYRWTTTHKQAEADVTVKLQLYAATAYDNEPARNTQMCGHACASHRLMLNAVVFALLFPHGRRCTPHVCTQLNGRQTSSVVQQLGDRSRRVLLHVRDYMRVDV
jgi:hypothetical protein